MFSLVILTLLFSLSLAETSCPGVISIRQDGPLVERLFISQEGEIHKNEQLVDKLDSCVDHVETVSPQELIYIVNGTLYFRTIGKGPGRILDTEVSTATYDRRTCTIYWISRGKMFYEAFQTRRSGELHAPVSPLHFYYSVIYVTSFALFLTITIVKSRQKIEVKDRPLVIMNCSEQ